MTAAPSRTSTDIVESDAPGVATPASTTQDGYPPFPPYSTVPAPASVADTIVAGREIRVQHKSVPKKPSRPPPRPAKPKSPKATDVKLSKKAMRAHASCLRKYNAVLTDRLEYISKPLRRRIIYLWREHADSLPPETIARLRAMLDADEPFKPDQAYEYFINLRKTKKKNANKMKVNQAKKDMQAMCCDPRYIWARNATVSLARGIQQRLSRPGRYVLADGMLRLSDIILGEFSGYMQMRTPSRTSTHPKAKFMMEIADKVAVWIDEILSESDDRMLMMDFDEDDDIIRLEAGDAGFTDDFLSMMAGALGSQPFTELAHQKLKGEMAEAFKVLTDAMTKKGSQVLLSHGKFKQTYAEAAEELKRAPDFTAEDYNAALSNELNNSLSETVKPITSEKLAPAMKNMVDIASNYLSQNAEFNKAKGPAFLLLVKKMKQIPNEELYQSGKVKRNYGQAAKELEQAKGMETDHDDPNLSQQIHSKLSKLIEKDTPADLKADMSETLDIASKYLSQKAVDEKERGPAFDFVVNELEKQGGEEFAPEIKSLETKHNAAHALKTAPGLTVSQPASTAPSIKEKLHKNIDPITPGNLKEEMPETIERSGDYLAAFARDREKAIPMLLEMLRSSPTKELVMRNGHTMTYGEAAKEIESAPILTPFVPVKDISDDIKNKLTEEMASRTPSEMQQAMKALINDAAGHLSQLVALKSGAAGDGFAKNLLAAIKKSLGKRMLLQHKAYKQTYAEGAEELRTAGPLQKDAKSEPLAQQVLAEMKTGVATRVSPTLTSALGETMQDAAHHLATVATDKGEALDHLMNLMKEQGDAPLAKMQGYHQTYADAVQRIEEAPNLSNDNIDKGIYDAVKAKLKALFAAKPSPSHAKVMPDVIEDVAKFLAEPSPQSDRDKKTVLAKLMARKGDEVLAKEGVYKMTYDEGAQHIAKAPEGKTTSHDDRKAAEMEEKVNAAISQKSLRYLLKDPIKEGAAHLTDVAKGKGEAMQAIHDALKKEKDKELVTAADVTKTHEQGAEMLGKTDKYTTQAAPAAMTQSVEQKIKALSPQVTTELGKAQMEETVKGAAQFIAGETAKEAGLPEDEEEKARLKRFAEYARLGLSPEEIARREAEYAKNNKGTSGRGDTQDEALKRRMAEYARLGLSPEEIARREAEYAKRMAEYARLGLSPEEIAKREAEHAKRMAEYARLGLSPEEIAKREAEHAKRMEEYAKLGLSPEEIAKREAEIAKQQAAEYTKLGLSPEEKAKREAEIAKQQAAGSLSPEEEARRKRMEEYAKLGLSPEEIARREAEFAKSHGTKDAAGVSPAEKAAREAEAKKLKKGAKEGETATERDHATNLLHQHLEDRGDEIFYKQSRMELTHKQAGVVLKDKWAAKPLRCSGDSDRLAKKFEKKLDNLVTHNTPTHIKDVMDDVIVESSRRLSDYFVSQNYGLLVQDALIAEMQRRGNEIIIDVHGVPETAFYAAQRLKMAKSTKAKAACSRISHTLKKKLEDCVRTATLPRKLIAPMKDHINETADYLSGLVTKPDEKIDAYIALLGEMEANGDKLLIDGTIPKSYKDAASYLRHLTKCEDRINRPNPALQAEVEGKLKGMMGNVTPTGYSTKVMNEVITDNTRLLVSYITLQGVRTEALRELIKRMDEEGDEVLLRHGNVRKSFKDGGDLLREINTDQLSVDNPDPVVIRKIQIKLYHVMSGKVPPNYAKLMDDVISDATNYLAVNLLHPQVIMVCKCMKSVFVQCELWCEEILRRVARPCCTCSRHVSSQALADLSPSRHLRISPGATHFHPGIDISLRPCPAGGQFPREPGAASLSCSAVRPSSYCPGVQTTPTRDATRDPTASYYMYSTDYDDCQQRWPFAAPQHGPEGLPRSRSSPTRSLLRGESTSPGYHASSMHQESDTTGGSFHTPRSGSPSSDKFNPYRSSPTTMYASVEYNQGAEREHRPRSPGGRNIEPELSRASSGCSTRAPIVTTDQMSDWHAMMVSLMWNVQAWRKWLQENIDLAVNHQPQPNESDGKLEREWARFQRRVTTEALQWRQYNIFSKQLTLRLALRYKDKQIVSPTRTTVKTDTYIECQREMLKIIEMFNKWTQWLMVIVKETETLKKDPAADIPLHEIRWNHFKKKVEANLSDWKTYNMHLKVCWENKYRLIISDWLPESKPGPVWVVSACGAVPSGAVAAGLFNGEVTWVARTTHKRNVMPAALLPSKHCCLVYADGAIHHYTKYQVMCNVEVRWVAWRAGEVGAQAVRVAPGVFVGRVLYRGSHLLGAVQAPNHRCHVVIVGRPFAFNCYELLVLDPAENK